MASKDKTKYSNEDNTRLGPTAQKILLLLLGGLVLGLNTRPDKYFKIISGIHYSWKEIDRRVLQRNIKKLYRSRLTAVVKNSDGSYTLTISQQGKNKALTYSLNNLLVPQMEKWDGKWRIVLFDIPEKSRFIRDALRYALRRAGFFEYQKSVFVHPFECEREIDFVIEFFHARPYTRFIIADKLDNEFHLKKHFGLE